MVETALPWVIACMLELTACGFPRPPDIVGDAPLDVLPDAGTCFGNDPFKLCFASAPTGAIDIATPTTFDTIDGTVSGTRLTCATTMSGGADYCVLAADTITISMPLRAVGTRPLVLLAADSILVLASIDVASRRQPTESIGAGADPTTGCNPGTPPTTANGTGGGGAGGSFVGVGSSGGNGGGDAGGIGGRHGNAIDAVNAVRGGCPGQDGSGTGGGAHGHGGGAVYLIAKNRIAVGGTINAGGEGGAGATGTDSGGGGAGAGGMIGFDATTIVVTGTLIANGGGGGEGNGGSGTSGNSGGDATSTSAAVGGANGSTAGGDGGMGSAGVAGGPGGTGQDGTINNGGGGGGAGGGAGLIKGPPASLGANVSPAASP